MKTIFKAKSMTFRIRRDEWDKMSTPNLSKEFDEFTEWLAGIEPFLSDPDKEAAKDASAEWRRYLDAREISRIRKRTSLIG